MKTNTRPYMIIVAVVAALFMLSVTVPVMAAEFKTFDGKITQEGKLMTDKGSSYWLVGPKAAQIAQNAGKRVEIKGMLREWKSDPNQLGPSLEVYSYKWLEGMEKKEMK